MGLVVSTLGPQEQDEVKKLEGEVMKALDACNKALKSKTTAAKAAARRWFGDDSDPFLAETALKAGRMRTVLNVKSIPCGFCPLKERAPGTNAAAYQPTGGWGNYTNITAATGETFKMEIDLNFRHLPEHATPNAQTTNGQSRFGTIVHELSHLVLGTKDQKLDNGHTAYTGQNARTLVTQDVDKAKTNAENWGCFVEEFRA